MQTIASALDQGATVVTASDRLARVLRREYNLARQRRGDAAWPAPAVLSWQAWLAELWEDCQFTLDTPPVLLDPWQERALWQEAVRESRESAALLQADAAAASAAEAWSLAHEWCLDLARIDSVGNEDARIFAAWARRFLAQCDARGLLDRARLAGFLCAAAPALRLPARVLLAGFDELSPRQQAFADACRAAGCAVEMAARPGPQYDGEAVRVALADPREEMEAAARWARALLGNEPAARIGVVVPDLAARARQVSRIFRNVLEAAAQLTGGGAPSRLYHVSAGEPLADRPLIGGALSLLALAPRDNQWDALSTLLLNPCVAGAVAERAPRALLDARLREAGQMRVSTDALLRLCREPACACPVLAQRWADWLRLRQQVPQEQTASAWSRTFVGLLDALGWPGEQPLDSVEFQTVEAWRRALSQFAATDAQAGPLVFGAALAWLGRMAAETMFQPESVDAPVEVMGTLEASGLRFDHLWVAGLHDEAWPGPAQPNPFLPLRMQREQRVPHCSAERELEFATLLTRRLLASAPDVVVSYPMMVEDREVALSPLILPLRKIDAAQLPRHDGEAYAETIRRSRIVEQLVDEQAPPVAAQSWQRGGSKVFQAQSACPFRAFAELRLGARDLEWPAPGLDARRRGTLVHMALELFWKEVRTQQALCARPDIAQVIAASARGALQRLQEEAGAGLPVRFLGLEQLRLERLLAAWLALEKQRGPFEVIQPEEQRFAELGGIRARVILDRVDRLPDGREIIIDYKTRRTTRQDWTSARPEEPQLPLYCATHPNPLAGVLFGQIKTGELRFCGWTEGADLVPGADSADLAALVGEWRVVLEQLAAGFRAGHAEAAPKDPNGSCRHCALAVLCRVAETGALDDEVEEEA